MTYTPEQIADEVRWLRANKHNDAADMIEALAAERDGQPIETAPTDGTPVIIAVTDGVNLGGVSVDDVVGEARYMAGEWYWAGFIMGHGDPVSEINYGHPTRWWPMPKAPKTAVCSQAAPQPSPAEEREHVRRLELQEIADGALGDDPRTRGAARDALCSQPALAAEREWQPIKTAPKDGTKFLVPYPLWNKGSTSEDPDEYVVIECYWEGSGWDRGGWMLHEQPEFWMSLPTFNTDTAKRLKAPEGPAL